MEQPPPANIGQWPLASKPMSRMPGSLGELARCSAGMRPRTSVSCARTLMKYEEVQQPTQSPQATSMPEVPVSAARMARSQVEKLPAGSGASGVGAGRSVIAARSATGRLTRGARWRAPLVEPRQRFGFAGEHFAQEAAVLCHDLGDLLGVDEFALDHEHHAQPGTGVLDDARRHLIALDHRGIRKAGQSQGVDHQVGQAELARMRQAGGDHRDGLLEGYLPLRLVEAARPDLGEFAQRTHDGCAGALFLVALLVLVARIARALVSAGAAIALVQPCERVGLGGEHVTAAAAVLHDEYSYLLRVDELGARHDRHAQRGAG